MGVSWGSGLLDELMGCFEAGVEVLFSLTWLETIIAAVDSDVSIWI